MRSRLVRFSNRPASVQERHKDRYQGQAVARPLADRQEIDKAKLLESILEPSIDRSAIRLASGRNERRGSHTGCSSNAPIPNRPEKADGKDVTIPTTQIERAARSKSR